MKITDPATISIIFAACSACACIGFSLGSTMRGIKARREQMRLWSQAEKLYRDRAIIDMRDDAPLSPFRSVE